MQPKDIYVLIACEESQMICKAFRARGFSAFSCDLLDCSGGHPEWHIKGDMFQVAKLPIWTLIIGHPECTRLTCAANKYYLPEYADRFPTIHEDREEAVEFFMKCTRLNAPHWAVENPIGIMSTRYRKPNQIIQPWWFGDAERKSTCLWTHNLPLLTKTNPVEPVIIKHASGKTDGKLHFETLKIKDKEERRKARSVTFPGVAEAMANQWGDFLLKKYA